jgi:hypothetical protein
VVSPLLIDYNFFFFNNEEKFNLGCKTIILGLYCVNNEWINMENEVFFIQY